MNITESEKVHAISLFVEVYGYMYKSIETILEESPVSEQILETWIERCEMLCKTTKELALATNHKKAIRAYKRAIELRGELRKERTKKWEICSKEH